MDKFNRAMEVYDEEMRQREIYIESVEENTEKRVASWAQALEAKVEKIEVLQKNYDKASLTIGNQMVKDAEKAADTIRSANVSNKLLKAGSNELMKLQVLGPQYQSESKKQTAILEKIAANTEKAAAKETVSAAASEELEVWNG